MNNRIPRIKIPLYQNQLDFVNDTIIRGELVNGEHLKKLEEALKTLFNRKYVLLTSNGFSAIFLTLQALKNEKQEIALPAISSCFSMVNAAKTSNYKINFFDVDMESQSIYEEIQQKDSSVVLAPNHFGKIATFNRRKNDTFIIEDSCQSFISSKNIKNNSDVMILSLYPSKLFNGIDGGVILTDNKELYTKVKSMVYYSNQTTFEEDSAFNFRLNNINASFAMATLEHIDEIEYQLKNIYEEFTVVLKEKKISFLEMTDGEVASKLILIFSNSSMRDKAFQYFLDKNIDVSTEFRFICPLEEQSLYTNAKEIVERSFSIPFHPLLTTKELTFIKNIIRELAWN